MHISALTPPEQRVLGCLLEKRWTTPDAYPLSLNALRLACNQSTNRDPVTDYDEATVRDAAQRLTRYGLTRLASYHGSRAIKYRHLAEEALGLGREELALLAVLLLRGPQTPGELKGRSERMAKLDSLADVERVLGVLIERGFVRRLERRPGQKEDRFEQLLGGEGEAAPAPSAPTTSAAPAPSAPTTSAAPAPSAPTTSAAPAPSAPSSTISTAPGPPAPAASPTPAAGAAPSPGRTGQTAQTGPSRDGDLAHRVAMLEDEVAALRTELAALKASG